LARTSASKAGEFASCGVDGDVDFAFAQQHGDFAVSCLAHVVKMLERLLHAQLHRSTGGIAVQRNPEGLDLTVSARPWLLAACSSAANQRRSSKLAAASPSA
jgi:hypothetical protein